MTTRFLSWEWRTNETSVFSEYWIDRPYDARTREGSLNSDARVGRLTGMRLKIEPLPTLLQATCRGIWVHGSWLDTVSTSANRGRRWRLLSSLRCSAAYTYWSGIGAYANVGPR